MSTALMEPKNYYLQDTDRRWTVFVAVSLVFHILLFSFGYWLQRRVEPHRMLHRNAIMVQTVRWAPDVREKHWLPRLEPTTTDPPKPEALKVTPNPNNPTPTEKAEKPEDKAQSAKERRAAMRQALEKIRNRYDSWDGSPTGSKEALSPRAMQVLGSVYAAQLRDVFSSRWVLPSVIPKDELRRLNCKILVKIDRTGKIVHHKLEQGSGNTQFDASAMTAVKRTPVVPLPDEMLRSLVFREGILIHFKWKD